MIVLIQSEGVRWNCGLSNYSMLGELGVGEVAGRWVVFSPGELRGLSVRLSISLLSDSCIFRRQGAQGGLQKTPQHKYSTQFQFQVLAVRIVLSGTPAG